MPTRNNNNRRRRLPPNRDPYEYSLPPIPLPAGYGEGDIPLGPSIERPASESWQANPPPYDPGIGYFDHVRDNYRRGGPDAVLGVNNTMLDNIFNPIATGFSGAPDKYHFADRDDGYDPGLGTWDHVRDDHRRGGLGGAVGGALRRGGQYAWDDLKRGGAAIHDFGAGIIMGPEYVERHRQMRNWDEDAYRDEGPRLSEAGAQTFNVHRAMPPDSPYGGDSSAIRGGLPAGGQVNPSAAFLEQLPFEERRAMEEQILEQEHALAYPEGEEGRGVFQGGRRYQGPGDRLVGGFDEDNVVLDEDGNPVMGMVDDTRNPRSAIGPGEAFVPGYGLMRSTGNRVSETGGLRTIDQGMAEPERARMRAEVLGQADEAASAAGIDDPEQREKFVDDYVQDWRRQFAEQQERMDAGQMLREAILSGGGLGVDPRRASAMQVDLDERRREREGLQGAPDTGDPVEDARRTAMAELTPQERLAVFEGQRTRDTGKRRKAQEIMDRVNQRVAQAERSESRATSERMAGLEAAAAMASASRGGGLTGGNEVALRNQRRQTMDSVLKHFAGDVDAAAEEMGMTPEQFREMYRELIRDIPREAAA